MSDTYSVNYPPGEGINPRFGGNCDERGSEEYNLALGERRARAAKEYLVNSGISNRRISTVSFGESNPVATGRSERAWQLNRRDDFVPSR